MRDRGRGVVHLYKERFSVPPGTIAVSPQSQKTF